MAPPASPPRPADLLRWPWALWLLPALPLGILLLSALEPQRPLALQPHGPATWLSEPFPLDAGPLGSPVLQVQARLPRDTSITYSVELLDGNDRVLLALSREGWRETGVWSEEGESGTYDESDSDLALPLRPPRSGPHRLRLRQEELSGSDGRPRAATVPFSATLARHRVNAPLLWLTSAAALVATTCAWQAIYAPRRRRAVLQARDPHLALRTDLGPGLVRLSVRVRYWTALTRPTPVPLQLRLHDGLGRFALQESRQIPLASLTIQESPVLGGRLSVLVRLPERQSCHVRVEVPETVGPAGPARSTRLSLRLTLEDGVRLPRAATVLEPWNAR